MNDNNNWSIQYLIKDLLGYTADTNPKARDYIWASDLGKPYIDTYLKMKGYPYSNPADGKGLMIFFLGRALEQGLKDILKQVDIAHDVEERLEVKAGPSSKYLPVVGKPDIVLEVKDWSKVTEKVKKRLDEAEDERATNKLQALLALIEDWKTRYPKGLKRVVFEVKSVNSWAFKYNKRMGGLLNAYPHHKFQLYTYMKGLNLNEGHMIYVAKDTGFMEETVIKLGGEYEEVWKKEIQTISEHYNSDKRPKAEPLMVDGKKNWRVNYSPYKDYVYGKEEDKRTKKD